MKKSIYKKCLIIFNPKAGQGMTLSPLLKEILGIKKINPEQNFKKEELVNKIKQNLENYGIKTGIVPTEYQGHAKKIAADAVKEGYDLVIAAGGDGTINEVVNGLAYSKTVLGIIPSGTINVLGIQLNLPSDIDTACRQIASGRQTGIDLGKVNSRYFTSMAGIGFDAHVVKKADSKFKKIFGALSYLFVALYELLFYKFRKIIIKLDNQPIPQKGYFVIILNGKYYAGELVVAEKASINDGYLDVCIFKHRNIFSIISYIFSIKTGRIHKNMDIQYFQCRKILVYKQGRHPVHVDAEYMGRTPVKIEVCPKALTIAN